MNILKKPYTNKQRLDFISNNKNMQIIVSGDGLYAIQPYEKMVDGVVVDNTEEYETQIRNNELDRISNLSLTAADVERGLYRAFGKDFEDIITLASNVEGVDVKALKIELKSNNFYRGNSYVSQIGRLLGLTEEQLNNFFETGDYTYLITKEE